MRVRDGDWWLVDHDLKLGRTVWAMSNPDGSTTYRTDYMAQPTIDQNTAQRNLSKKDWGGDYHHVASIPLNVFWDRLGEASRQNDEKFISKWLNDSNNRAWRTKSGTV